MNLKNIETSLSNLNRPLPCRKAVFDIVKTLINILLPDDPNNVKLDVLYETLIKQIGLAYQYKAEKDWHKKNG